VVLRIDTGSKIVYRRTLKIRAWGNEFGMSQVDDYEALD
jgi:hypothetical protein